MTKEQEQIREFHFKAGQDAPQHAVIPDLKTRFLRVKLLLEEVLELAAAMGVKVYTKFGPDSRVEISEERLSFTANANHEPDLVLIADALADIQYVNLGASVACGIDLDEIFQEVHRSNMSKFIDGYRRDDGKWIKGPSYTPSNLQPFVFAQMMRGEPPPDCKHEAGFTHVETRAQYGEMVFSCNACNQAITVPVSKAAPYLDRCS